MNILQCIFEGGDPDPDDLRALAAIAPNLVLVFGGEGVFSNPGLHALLRKAFPEAHLAGCSTAGEIAGNQVFDGSCVVTAIRFEASPPRVASGRILAMEDSEPAGTEIGRALNAADLKGVLLLSKGVGVNGSAVIQGITRALPPGVVITGGLAGDGGAFQRTLVLNDHGVDNAGVVGIGFYGAAVRIGYGLYGGWEPFGPVRRVTRSQDNLLFELDGEPALNVYQRYLGDYAKDLPASGLLFPFEMLDGDHSRLGLIRTILGINEADGSLVLAGDIDPNGFLRLMHASTEALVNGAETAAKTTRRMVESCGAGLAVLISCVGRKLVMGDHVDEEVEVVAQALAGGTVITGFYSYGEISPISASTDCKLHNQTMTITFISEVLG